MQADVETIHHFGQELAKMLPVAVVAENGTPFIASGGDVITTAGPLDSQWASHDRSPSNPPEKINLQLSNVEMSPF